MPLRFKTVKDHDPDPIRHEEKVFDKRNKQSVLVREANRLLKSAGFMLETGEKVQLLHDEYVDDEPSIDREILLAYLEDTCGVVSERALLGLEDSHACMRRMTFLEIDDDERISLAELGMHITTHP